MRFTFKLYIIQLKTIIIIIISIINPLELMEFNLISENLLLVIA